MQFARTFLASIALVALAFSSVEGAAAAACASPLSDMGGRLTVVHDGAATQWTHAGCADADTRPERDEEAPCPFGPASAGCAAASALPATTSIALAPSPEDTGLRRLSETGASLFLGSSLFRPPRA